MLLGWGRNTLTRKMGEYKRKGRDPYATDLTKESQERFTEKGRRCWEEMEKLRIEWEDRLRQAGVAVEME